jgi:hypothetical protein
MTRITILTVGLLVLPALGAVAQDSEPADDPGSGTESSLPTAGTYDKPGFRTVLLDGRLWVLRPGQEIAPKHVTYVGYGPEGLTVKALDRETVLAYLAARPGFRCDVRSDGIHVWPSDSDGEPPTPAARAGVGPLGTTVHAPDEGTIELYLGGETRSDS